MPSEHAALPVHWPANDTVVRELTYDFGRMLQVVADQLAESLRSADQQCLILGDSLHSLAKEKSVIEGVCGDQSQTAVIRSGCDNIGKSLDIAVGALQHHDRLMQQIEHIRHVLQQLRSWVQPGTELTHGERSQKLRHIADECDSQGKRLYARPSADGGFDGQSSVTYDSSIELF